jgi:hypothetical protein
MDYESFAFTYLVAFDVNVAGVEIANILDIVFVTSHLISLNFIPFNKIAIDIDDNRI